jgi:hypothetical protein
MPTGGAVKLTIDADKYGWVEFPDGTMQVTVAGVINTTYTGATGEIKYFVPKNTSVVDISISDVAKSITAMGVIDLRLVGCVEVASVTTDKAININASGCVENKNIIAPKAITISALNNSLTAKSIGDIIYSAVLDSRENVNFNFSGGTNAIYADIYAYYLAKYGVQLNESYLDSNCPNNTILFNI